jgi:hypothetical protein
MFASQIWKNGEKIGEQEKDARTVRIILHCQDCMSWNVRTFFGHNFFYKKICRTFPFKIHFFDQRRLFLNTCFSVLILIIISNHVLAACFIKFLSFFFSRTHFCIWSNLDEISFASSIFLLLFFEILSQSQLPIL